MSLIDDLNALNGAIDSLKGKITDALNSAYAASHDIDPDPVAVDAPVVAAPVDVPVDVPVAPADVPAVDPTPADPAAEPTV